MQHAELGSFGRVSRLTLGGGGLGLVWGESTEDEAIMLLAHGLLHLLGLDHRNRREERRMTARTDLLRSAARDRVRSP